MKSSWTRNCKPRISSHLLLIKSLSPPVSPWNPALTLVLQIRLVFAFHSLISQQFFRKLSFSLSFLFLAALSVQWLLSFPWQGEHMHTGSAPRSRRQHTRMHPAATDHDCCLSCWLRAIVWHCDKYHLFHLHLSLKSWKNLSLLFWWSYLPLCIPALTRSIFFIPCETGFPFKPQDQHQETDLHHQLDFPAWFCSAVKYFILR